MKIISLPHFQCFPDSSVVRNPPVNAEDTSSIPGLGKSPEEGNGNPLNNLPGKSHEQRSLVSYSLWGSQRVAQHWARTHAYSQISFCCWFHQKRIRTESTLYVWLLSLSSLFFNLKIKFIFIEFKFFEFCGSSFFSSRLFLSLFSCHRLTETE